MTYGNHVNLNVSVDKVLLEFSHMSLFALSLGALPSGPRQVTPFAGKAGCPQ